jgi:hypothetical protein
MSHGRHLDHVQHVNDNHSDDLLAAARAFSGHPDATAARAERIDRDGIDLLLDTPDGLARARVAFSEAVAGAGPDGLRVAFADLTRRARTTLAARSNESSS